MAQQFERDRFDELPPRSGRVGAHRAPAKPYRGLKRFAWAAGAAVLLSGVGIGSLIAIDNNLFDPSDILATFATPTPTPTVTPMLDPSVAVTILNGTPTIELGTQAAETLSNVGLTVEATAAADTTTVAESTVFYAEPGYEAAARGVARELGIATVTRSDGYSLFSPITVVIGANFVPQILG